jgi:hypothetical protein
MDIIPWNGLSGRIFGADERYRRPSRRRAARNRTADGYASGLTLLDDAQAIRRATGRLDSCPWGWRQDLPAGDEQWGGGCSIASAAAERRWPRAAENSSG